MLFENDGGAADVVNAFTEIHGDGAVMDAMRSKMAREQEGKMLAERQALAAIAARVNETERRAEEQTGLIPDFSVPAIHYHQYAAEFKFAALERGIVLEGNGYECWACQDFIAFYKRKHPENVFKEAKRNTTIIVNEGASAPLKKSFTHGGLIAA